jgi:hypothetical protein
MIIVIGHQFFEVLTSGYKVLRWCFFIIIILFSQNNVVSLLSLLETDVGVGMCGGVRLSLRDARESFIAANCVNFHITQ